MHNLELINTPKSEYKHCVTLVKEMEINDKHAEITAKT